MSKKPKHHHVVVLGASPKPARYAHQAQQLLMDKGYKVTPVHPNFDEVLGIPTVHEVGDIDSKVHTLTLYVGSQRLVPHIDALMDLAPKRVIFNPGTELVVYRERLDDAGIEWIEGCTLVMLKTGVF